MDKKQVFIGTMVKYSGTLGGTLGYIESETKDKDGEFPQLVLEDQDNLFEDGEKYKITVERID